MKKQNSDFITQLYYYKKERITYYRAIYFTLSLILLSLGVLVFFQYSSVFFIPVAIKSAIGMFSTLFGLFAGGVGLMLKAETDVCIEIWNKGRKKLARTYHYGQVSQGGFFSRSSRTQQLKTTYLQARDELREAYDETILLLKEADALSMDLLQKEELFHQALRAFHQRSFSLTEELKRALNIACTLNSPAKIPSS